MANISACTDAGAALIQLLSGGTGYPAGNPPQYYSQPRVGCSFPNMQQTGQIPNGPPQVGAEKLLLLAIIPVPLRLTML